MPFTYLNCVRGILPANEWESAQTNEQTLEKGKEPVQKPVSLPTLACELEIVKTTRDI